MNFVELYYPNSDRRALRIKASNEPYSFYVANGDGGLATVETQGLVELTANRDGFLRLANLLLSFLLDTEPPVCGLALEPDGDLIRTDSLTLVLQLDTSLDEAAKPPS